MTNSELAKQAYEINNQIYGSVTGFPKCAGLGVHVTAFPKFAGLGFWVTAFPKCAGLGFHVTGLLSNFGSVAGTGFPCRKSPTRFRPSGIVSFL